MAIGKVHQGIDSFVPDGWNLFTAEQQKQLIDEDLAAGRTVPMILFGVLALGLLALIVVVLTAI